MGLTVCPHCGRGVRPAGPRWGLWAAGLVAIVLIGLWGIGRLPVESAVEGVKSTRARLIGLVQVLGPAATPTEGPADVVLTPQALALAAEDPFADDIAAEQVVEELPVEEVIPPEEGPLAAEQAGIETPVAAAEGVTTTVVLTSTVALTPTAASELPTSTATATGEPTATATLTPEPTATATTQPTAPPTATATAVPPTATSTPAPPALPPGKTTYTVRSGDTLSIIAERFGITWPELAEANGLTSRTVLRAGQELVIPVKGAVAPQPAAQGTPTTYTVRSGDNLSNIAKRFGIGWQELAAANGLGSRAVLRIGQVLTIPVQNAAPPADTPSASASATPEPGATARPPTATARAVTELPAPAPRGPGDQTPFSGDGAYIELQWNPVSDMLAGQEYQVVVRWIEQGNPEEHWWFTTATGSRVPPWLWGRADQPARQYTWFVRVVEVTTDGQGGERVIPVSQPSTTRTFYWN
jgi:LysM repeat protein